MGRRYKEYKYTEKSLFVCAKCGTHLVAEEDLISKEFMASTGKAFLFANV